MSQKHVLVIGGGVGGLATSALLSSRGLRVTLLEKTDRLGGVTNPVLFGSDVFTGGPSLVMMPELFTDFAVQLRKASDFFSLHPLRNPLRFQIDKEGAFKEYDWSEIKYLLEDCSARQFLSYGERLRPWVLAFMKGDRLPMGKAPFPFFGSLSVGGLFDISGVKSREERLILSLPISFVGVPPMKAPYLFSYLSYAMYREGVYSIKNGISGFADQLVEYCLANGVSLHCNTTVAKVDIRGRRIKGVTTDQGAHFDADLVVMALPEHARSKIIYSFRDTIRASRISGYSLSLVYCKIRTKITETEEHGVVVMNRKKDPDHAMFQSLYIHRESANTYTVLVVHEESAPILEEISRRAIQGLSQFISVSSSYIEVLGVRTGIDYAGNFGYHPCFPLGAGHDWFDLITRQPNRDRYYRNLFYVGAGSWPGIGLPTVIASALRTLVKIERVL